ncbi:hypothetical protein BGZ60DRAFT_565849 [Tricladium varicosporioides]|nr:hypothetical protein BGZ60DRAFT_565849 [Hymenoscyphus varicosporioides]
MNTTISGTPSITTSFTTSSSTSTNDQPVTTTTTPADRSTSNKDLRSSSRLSTSIKARITVGATLSPTAIGATLRFFFFLGRRAATKHAEEVSKRKRVMETQKWLGILGHGPSITSEVVGGTIHVSELATQRLLELDANRASRMQH